MRACGLSPVYLVVWGWTNFYKLTRALMAQRPLTFRTDAVDNTVFVIPAKAGIHHRNFRFHRSTQLKSNGQVMD
jgi:hypothetical protein